MGNGCDMHLKLLQTGLDCSCMCCGRDRLLGLCMFRLVCPVVSEIFICFCHPCGLWYSSDHGDTGRGTHYAVSPLT